MSTLILETNPMFTTDVQVETTGAHTEQACVKIMHHYRDSGSSHRTSELFLTPTQLELMGRFLIRQAEELRQVHNQ
jgi:hypothetical protein